MGNGWSPSFLKIAKDPGYNVKYELYVIVSTMQLEDYFEFLSPYDIRIKGHRIGIDDVIRYYLDGYSPEQIQTELPSLNLEKIYATITYYLQNRTEIDTYMSRLAREREQNYQAWVKSEPSPAVKRIRELKAQKLNFVG